MPQVETTNDLAETVADWLGIYGCCDPTKCHENGMCCRIAFMLDFPDRMRTAVENEKKLNSLNL